MMKDSSDLTTSSLQTLYAISGMDVGTVLDVLFDQQLLERLEEIKNSQDSKDNYLYILHICSNVAEKCPEKWEMLVQSELFQNALIDLKECNCSQIVLEASYFILYTFENLDNDSHLKLDIVQRMDILFEPMIAVLSEPKFDHNTMHPCLYMLRSVLNFWVESGKFHFIESMREIKGDEVIENLLHSENTDLRNLAQEIYQEHFSYDIDDAMNEDAYNFEGNRSLDF